DDNARRAERDQGRGGLTLEGHLLWPANGVVWNHHGTGVAARIARLERDVERTADPRLEPRPRAGIFRRIQIEVVAIGSQVDRPHYQQPIARTQHRHTLRRTLARQIRWIEIDLGALNRGLRQA